MPLAKEVAQEFRKLANCFDKMPDAEIKAPLVIWHHFDFDKDGKAKFLSLAKILPRPLVKGENYSQTEIQVSHQNNSIHIEATVSKSLTCELVEPAKPAVYRCEPILSLEEEDSLSEA